MIAEWAHTSESSHTAHRFGCVVLSAVRGVGSALLQMRMRAQGLPWRAEFLQAFPSTAMPATLCRGALGAHDIVHPHKARAQRHCNAATCITATLQHDNTATLQYASLQQASLQHATRGVPTS
jgi:hypothetical protein